MRIYIGFQATKILLFSSPKTTTTTTTTTFLLFFILLLLISIGFPPLPPPPPHSIVFYPSPTRFIFFSPRDSIKDCQLPSLVHFEAMSQVVKNNRGFLQFLAVCPAHQRQFLLRTVSPQQLHALVQVLYNILNKYILYPRRK